MNKKRFISKIDPRFLNGIAHRGLHNKDFTENGLKAFQNAIEHNVAFEYDIHITKDNKLVVCHDEDLVRTTGKEGIIEDLTAEEIRQNYRLLDGGVVPTFEEVLELNHGQVPMVIELKVFRKNYKELCAAFKKVVHLLPKEKEKVMLISFDPRALARVRHLGYRTSFLVAESHFWTYPFRVLFNSIDIEQVLFREKKVVRYSRRHFVNVWTIESKEQLEKLLPYVDTATYQHVDPEEIKKLLTK